MKKLLIGLIATAAISVNAFGLDGTVGDIRVSADGTIHVKVGAYLKPLVGTPDAIKAMYAAALTAKASVMPVTVGPGEYNSVSGWTVFKLQ